MKKKSLDDYDAPELASLQRSSVVDGVLRFSAYAATLGAVMVAPNIVQAVDKPLASLDTTLDARKRRREIMKTIYYMKAHGYLAGDYEHGLQLTGKAKRRLERMQRDTIVIAPPPQWDGIWRVVIYDIPEDKKAARQIVASLLRQAGCFQLQKSTWITPFACRDAIAAVAVSQEVDEYITYFEATYLDNAGPLVKRFQRKYPLVVFDAPFSPQPRT